MLKYFKVWFRLTINSFSLELTSRTTAILFILGKFIRFGFFLLFLVILLDKTKALAGFGTWQVILFFLTFNLIDTVSQFFFREVYRFRHYVVSGNLDLILVKPMSSLFRSLTGGADLMDFLTIPPLVAFIIYVIGKIGSIGVGEIILYILLVFNGLVLTTAFHIIVLAIAILTTEIDHTIMIYRDITQMGRVPIDIYNQFLRGLLTFVLPVGIMMTFPVKALLGVLSLPTVLLSFVITGVFFFGSLKLWNYSLKNYTSASS